ncbi:MAG: hypothetical protein AB9917_13550 [Negativicutes bacterium]
MACAKVHWEQGEHNENFATDLATSSPADYKDWAVVATFYAAVHFVESYVIAVYNKNSDVLCKTSPTANNPHNFRQDIVAQDFNSEALRKYKSLRNASNIARYLRINGYDINVARGNYFPDNAVLDFIAADLSVVKGEIQKKLPF